MSNCPSPTICFLGTWFRVDRGHPCVSFPLPWAGPHPSPSPAPGSFASGFALSFTSEHLLSCLTLHPHGFQGYRSGLLRPGSCVSLQSLHMVKVSVSPIWWWVCTGCLYHPSDGWVCRRWDRWSFKRSSVITWCQVSELEHRSALLMGSRLAKRFVNLIALCWVRSQLMHSFVASRN